MLDIDLREYTQENRTYFWKGAQEALRKLITTKDESKDGIIYIFTILLDMHKRIKLGEKPELLNHSTEIEPYSGLQKGPGWH